MRNQDKKISLSVIMTALNEEENIVSAVENILEAFSFYKIPAELIVVNDGSTDTTPQLLEELQKRYPQVIRIIHHPRPCGVGASFWDGVDEAWGEVVVWFPADRENDAKEILRYFPLTEEVDIVLPFIFNKEVRPLFRRLLSGIYNFIINFTFLSSFNYTNGTSLYRRSVLKELEHRHTGFFFQTDIVIRAVKKGYLFGEVPCRLRRRSRGESKAISFRSLRNLAKGYLRLLIDFYSGRIKGAKAFAADSATARRRKELN